MESAPNYEEGLDAPIEENAQPDVREQRHLITRDYERAALSRTSIYGRRSGAATTQLQFIAEEMGAAIVDELESHPHTVDEIRELHPDIKLLVKVNGEINKDREFQSEDLHRGIAVPQPTTEARSLPPKRRAASDEG